MSSAQRSRRQRAGDVRATLGVRMASLMGHFRRQRVVHMLHIRKTGGTAVKAALSASPAPRGLRLLLHPHRVALGAIPPSDEVFFFLRDPVARFVSGFESRRREGRPAHYHPWSASERRAYERFRSADDLARALDSSDGAERSAAERAMNSINHVRSHLAHWLGDEQLLRARRERIILVGWQETLDTDFRRLVDLLDLPPGTTLPIDDAVAHRSVPDGPREQLSDPAAAAIRKWYASDYGLIDVLVELGLTERPAPSAVIGDGAQELVQR